MNKRCKILKVCSRKGYSVRNKKDSLAYDIYDLLQELKEKMWTTKMFVVLSCCAENFNDYFETKFAVLLIS